MDIGRLPRPRNTATVIPGLAFLARSVAYIYEEPVLGCCRNQMATVSPKAILSLSSCAHHESPLLLPLPVTAEKTKLRVDKEGEKEEKPQDIPRWLRAASLALCGVALVCVFSTTSTAPWSGFCRQHLPLRADQLDASRPIEQAQQFLMYVFFCFLTASCVLNESCLCRGRL